MSTAAIQYDVITGGILGVIFHSAEDGITLVEGVLMIDPVKYSYLVGLYNVGDAYYLDLATLLPILRPIQIITLDKTTLIADGVDTLTITGAVANSAINILGKSSNNRAFGETCSDPETFSTEIPDTYTLTISCFPYLDFTATIEAS